MTPIRPCGVVQTDQRQQPPDADFGPFPLRYRYFPANQRGTFEITVKEKARGAGNPCLYHCEEAARICLAGWFGCEDVVGCWWDLGDAMLNGLGMNTSNDADEGGYDIQELGPVDTSSC